MTAVAEQPSIEPARQSIEPAKQWWDVRYLLLLAVLCLAASALHNQKFAQFSPFDEATHLDYALTIADFDLPSRGEIYHTEVLTEWSCRGFWDSDAVGAVPSCDDASPDLARTYPGNGEQRNESPPFYYALVVVLSAVPRALLGDGPLGPMRLTGAVFLFVGLVAILESYRLLGGERRYGFLLMATVPFAVPLLILPMATLTNDAGTFTMGAVVVAAALHYAERGQRAWILIVLACLAGFTKQTALFPVLAAAGLLLVDKSSNVATRTRVGVAVAMPISTFVSGEIWSAIATARAMPGWVNPVGLGGSSQPIVGSPVDEVLSQPLIFVFGPLTDIIRPVSSKFWVPEVGIWAQALLMISLMGVGAAAVSGTHRIRSLAWAYLAAAIVGSMMIQARTIGGSDPTYFTPIPSRYGIGLLPLALLFIAYFGGRTATTRALTPVVAVISALFCIFSLT